jgi:hypothetical protein
MRSFALLALLASPALGGCLIFGGDDDDNPCSIDGATELAISFADETGDVQDVTEGGAVPLIGAPQGGFIILIGPRVRAASSACQLLIQAGLRDPASNREIGRDRRLLQIHQRADGWSTPTDPASLADLANVPVCPTSVTSAIDGKPFRLELEILDDGGRAITATSAMIRPTCNNAFCRSNCPMQ